MFKRFTLLVVGFFKERFVWARRKPDTTDADHDKRIAENYVFDEVLGVYVSRSEFERRAKFNNDQTSQEAGVYANESDINKTVHFPNRFEQEQTEVNKHMEFILSIGGKPSIQKLKPANRKSNIK
ncbi:conjugal transfer protein, partial [Salmonella enterica]|nr:conjugal transfer protein [Salmonella enterica]